MKKIVAYRVYKELTDNNGVVVHKRPMARMGKESIAFSYARTWSNGVMPNGVYAIYDDGTEERIGGC